MGWKKGEPECVISCVVLAEKPPRVGGGGAKDMQRWERE